MRIRDPREPDSTPSVEQLEALYALPDTRPEPEPSETEGLDQTDLDYLSCLHALHVLVGRAEHGDKEALNSLRKISSMVRDATSKSPI